MLPGMELMGCTDLAVPAEVMQHVVRVESSFNPYAIGVVGGRLARQPQNLPEAVSTARMLEQNGYNFSLGLAQVNRHNLARHGLAEFEKAFEVCPNLKAGSRILAECYQRAGNDWGKALSCYYSGNFETGFRHGYVQKVQASWRGAQPAGAPVAPIQVIDRQRGATGVAATPRVPAAVSRRVLEASGPAPASRRQPVAAADSIAPPAPAQMQAAPPVVAAALPAAPGAAVPAQLASASDAPVTVQLMGARPASAAPAAPTSPAGARTAPAQPERDAAFVF